MAQAAVDLAQRFDGITVANRPLQERYGGTGGFGVTPFAASGCSLPSGPGPEMPGAHETRRDLTNCSPAGAGASAAVIFQPGR
jgi:hypothetical protein